MYRIESGKGRVVAAGLSMNAAKKRAVRLYSRRSGLYVVRDNDGNTVWVIGS